MSATEKALITYRNAEATDLAFVYASWLQGLYHGNDWFGQIPEGIFFNKYHQVIETILKRPTIRVRVACLQDDADVILGYAVMEQRSPEVDTIHWTFVKPAWRKLGIASRLIPDTIKTTTHISKIGKNLKPKKWVFDPFAL